MLVATKVQTHELSEERQRALTPLLDPVLRHILNGSSTRANYNDAALLATSSKLPAGYPITRKLLAAKDQPDEIRLRAFDALVAARDETVINTAGALLADKSSSSALKRGLLDSLGRFEDERVAHAVLEVYDKLDAPLQPQAIELLTERPAWARTLVSTVAEKRMAPSAVNVNQVRRLTTSKDPSVSKQATEIWGTVRADRNPQCEQVVAEMRELVRRTLGDPLRGQIAFQKLCGQCHKIYGQGQDVGPDITVNGRASFEQLLSNVFDPSLVIGSSYQARLVQTSDGRTLTGLMVEDSPQRIVLKVQGGKLETIARADVEAIEVSKLSLMPEGVEKQYQPQEIADLLAFLLLDRPPADPQAKSIPGAPQRKP
jgi:putative heme-binding domain-containing protein